MPVLIFKYKCSNNKIKKLVHIFFDFLARQIKDTTTNKRERPTRPSRTPRTTTPRPSKITRPTRTRPTRSSRTTTTTTRRTTSATTPTTTTEEIKLLESTTSATTSALVPITEDDVEQSTTLSIPEKKSLQIKMDIDVKAISVEEIKA